MASNNRIGRYDKVRILKYADDPFNEFGLVTHTYNNGDVWVSNMNMPFQGTINQRFTADEVELIKSNCENEPTDDTSPEYPIGGCSCMTKNPDPKYHSRSCAVWMFWRILELEEQLEQCKMEQEEWE